MVGCHPVVDRDHPNSEVVSEQDRLGQSCLAAVENERPTVHMHEEVVPVAGVELGRGDVEHRDATDRIRTDRRADAVA